jgi:hypothetical protein
MFDYLKKDKTFDSNPSQNESVTNHFVLIFSHFCLSSMMESSTDSFKQSESSSRMRQSRKRVPAIQRSLSFVVESLQGDHLSSFVLVHFALFPLSQIFKLL